MFPILINLILTPIAYTFKCRFYKQSDSVAMGRQETSTASKIYMQTHEKTVISTVLCSPKVLEQFVDVISVIPKLRYLENILNRNRNLHQNIKFAMEEESNEKLKSVYTLMKRNNRDISVLLKRILGILSDTHIAAITSKQALWKAWFPPCSIEGIITDKNYLTK